MNTNMIIMLVAGFLSGLIGGMGLGGGGVLIIYLTVFAGVEQLRAQGINLLFFIPIAVASCAVYAKRKQIEYKTVLFAVLGGVLGTLGGSLLSGYIGGDLLSKLFGGGLVALGLYTLFSKQKNGEKENQKN